jgi:hypothetical protein
VISEEDADTNSLCSSDGLNKPNVGLLKPGIRNVLSAVRLRGRPLAYQVEGDVNEHVFLSPDQSPTSGFFEKRARVDIEPVGDRFGVAQEA